MSENAGKGHRAGDSWSWIVNSLTALSAFGFAVLFHQFVGTIEDIQASSQQTHDDVVKLMINYENLSDDMTDMKKSLDKLNDAIFKLRD